MVMGGSWPRTTGVITGTTPGIRARIITRSRTGTTRIRATRAITSIRRITTRRITTPCITTMRAITAMSVTTALGTTRFISRVWQGVAAFGLIVAGVSLWSVPAALIVAGVLLLADRLT
jgi:hypothetical protein